MTEDDCETDKGGLETMVRHVLDVIVVKRSIGRSWQWNEWQKGDGKGAWWWRAK